MIGDWIGITSSKVEQVANSVVEIGNRTVGGTNLIKNTSNQLQHLERSNWHIFASIEKLKADNVDNESEE